MWRVYKWDGHYIQGELISSHSSEAAALKAAKKAIPYLKATKSKSRDIKARKEIVIWLDGKAGEPLGVIVKKVRKTKKGDEMVSTE